MPNTPIASPHASAQGASGSLGAIIPRWEWRRIDRTLPLDPARLLIAPGDVKASGETYLLSTLTPHNIKVRADLLEIKRLQERAADGLERWRPTARSAFPLDAATLAELWDAWGIAAPVHLTVVGSLADLARDVVSSHAALRRVDLVKHRRRISLAGCNGELVELDIEGVRWVSVAFEDADPALVRAAVAASGLDPQTNLNYPAALKRIVGLPVVVTEAEGVR